MPGFPADMAPITHDGNDNSQEHTAPHEPEEPRLTVSRRSPPTESERLRIRTKNRRKRYLDAHPEYFGPDLELANPLLYDRLIRRYQSAAEREAEGRAKGFSGVLEADLWRAEAKAEALRNPAPGALLSYHRGPDGEIVEEDLDELPESKEEAYAWWKWEMEMRFLRGGDADFEYAKVDESDEWDDWETEDREALERYIDSAEPEWCCDESLIGRGETGILDY